ncbi:hypothetical protein V1527DRAFT_476007 [Lipomyces starkeyi]
MHTVWKGTGAPIPEGPDIYKKDEYYYWMQAQVGTGIDLMITIARSRQQSCCRP